METAIDHGGALGSNICVTARVGCGIISRSLYVNMAPAASQPASGKDNWCYGQKWRVTIRHLPVISANCAIQLDD